LDRYNKFITDLEPFEGWKKKVEEEVGNWIHQIYNNMEESKAKRRIFMKMVHLQFISEQTRIFHLIPMIVLYFKLTYLLYSSSMDFKFMLNNYN